MASDDDDEDYHWDFQGMADMAVEPALADMAVEPALADTAVEPVMEGKAEGQGEATGVTMAAVQGYGQDGLRESWDARQGGQPFRGASKDIIAAAFLDAGCMASRRRAGPEPVQEDFLHEGRSASCGSGTNGGLEHVWSPRGGGPFSHALAPPCMDPHDGRN